MSDPQRDILKMLRENEARQEQTAIKEVPGGIPGFTSFYAVGTFTPVFQGTGTPGTWAYSVQTGFYTRIGNRVMFNLFVAASSRSVAPTGNARIINLPFTSDATANNYNACAIGGWDALTLSATIIQLSCRIPPSAAYIEFLEDIGTAPSAGSFLAATGWGTTGAIIVSGAYTA